MWILLLWIYCGYGALRQCALEADARVDSFNSLMAILLVYVLKVLLCYGQRRYWWRETVSVTLLYASKTVYEVAASISVSFLWYGRKLVEGTK